MTRPNWSRPLPRPLCIIDNGKEFLRLSTLADVRTLVKRIPKDRRTVHTWMVVSRRLDDASVGRGSVDDVSVALRMAFQLERIEYR